jgi:hypothetical protein
MGLSRLLSVAALLSGSNVSCLQCLAQLTCQTIFYPLVNPMRYLALRDINILACDGRMHSSIGKMAQCNAVNKLWGTRIFYTRIQCDPCATGVLLRRRIANAIIARRQTTFFLA